MMTRTSDLPSLSSVVTALLVITSLWCDAAVIDLTHQLKEGESLTWPSNPRFNFTILSRAHNPTYDTWLENNMIELAEHTGTHMDAPAHMEEGRWRVHQVPVNHLVGPGVLVDVREKVKGNPTYGVTVEDLTDWESEHGRIPDKAVVLVNAGWASRYPDWNRVWNTQNLQDTFSFHYPSVTLEAARWLVENRSIIAVGIDSPGPEAGNNGRWPVHKALLSKDILILENVANLNSLPPKDFTVFLGAMKIFDGSGAPLRMVAVSGDHTGSGGGKLQSSPLSVSITAAIMSLGLFLVRMMVH